MAVKSINYEVYALQGTRWNFHAHFDGRDREKALEEALVVERLPNVDGAVVVRESFNPDDGEGTESVIYHTSSMKSKPSVSSISGGSAAPPTRAAAPKGAPQKKPVPSKAPKNTKTAGASGSGSSEAATPKGNQAQSQAQPQPQGLPQAHAKVDAEEELSVFQLLVSFFMAIFGGVGLAIVVYLIMKFSGVFFGRNITLGILIGVFVATFLVLFIPRLKKVLGTTEASSSGSKGNDKSKIARDMFAGIENSNIAMVPPEVAAQALRSKNNPTATETEADNEYPISPKASTVTGPTESSSAANNPSKKAGLNPTDSLAACDLALSKIVLDAVSIVGETVKSDAYLRFGMILYMSGACEELMHIHNLNKEAGVDLLIHNVSKLGLPKEQAKGFCTNVDEYLLDEKYFDMYAMGRANQIKHPESQGGKSNTEEAIQSWRYPDMKKTNGPDARSNDSTNVSRQPIDAEPERKFVSVLFTDIVDSTKHQQTQGEEWMMQVIRAHNDIIREAINRYAGREIKHTGDGIMASFPAVVNSVEAGLAMQGGVQAFSKAMESMAFQITIGISAGEPIHENGDLFGTPVNMAARVLSKAKTGQVAVSAIVMEMCRGKPFSFTSCGDFDLKGFDDKQTVYLVESSVKAKASE